MHRSMFNSVPIQDINVLVTDSKTFKKDIEAFQELNIEVMVS